MEIPLAQALLKPSPKLLYGIEVWRPRGDVPQLDSTIAVGFLTQLGLHESLVVAQESPRCSGRLLILQFAGSLLCIFSGTAASVRSATKVARIGLAVVPIVSCPLMF